MSLVIPLYNFVIYFITGSVLILFSPLCQYVGSFYIYHNNLFGIVSIVIFVYIVSYVIGLLSSYLFCIFDHYVIKSCLKNQESQSNENNKNSSCCNDLKNNICPRWKDYDIIKHFKEYPVLEIYAREYSFRCSMATIMLILFVCECINNSVLFPFSLCIYSILFLVFLLGSYQMTSKVDNVIKNIKSDKWML